MIRMLSLAAALAVLPLSAAFAASDPDTARTPSEVAVEAAASAFEARMETFGTRAEAIQGDKSLSEAEREARVAALWSEYQPEVAVFTAAISEHAGKIAEEALANIDVDAMVEEALSSPEVQSSMAAAGAMASNGAWASNDPEQLVTYQLMAQYGVDEAMEGIGDAAEVSQADVAQAQADAAKAAEDAARATVDANRPR